MARPKRLSKETVLAIREAYAKGDMTQEELAAAYRLSQSTICKIVNNYIHRYVNILVQGEAQVRVGYKYGN